MASPSQNEDWTVEQILADEAGIAFYLDQYRAFRLLSLEKDPSGQSSPDGGMCCMSLLRSAFIITVPPPSRNVDSSLNARLEKTCGSGSVLAHF